MHKPKEDLPVKMEAPGTTVRAMGGLGGMVIAYDELPAGADFTPMFEGLPDDKCPCPHWGYVLKGAIRLRYTDGKEEVVKAGEVFYMPSGHTALVEEDAAMIEISPEKGYNEVMEHIASKMSG
jgi:hypothetical protein